MNEELKKYVQAFIDGEEVEWCLDCEEVVEWRSNLSWDWKLITDFESFDYFADRGYKFRIKPKDKVKMWQWIFQGEYGNPNISSYFYKDEEEARDAIYDKDITLLRKAEWTEIEVEE